jgi:hypothetical protein
MCVQCVIVLILRYARVPSTRSIVIFTQFLYRVFNFAPRDKWIICNFSYIIMHIYFLLTSAHYTSSIELSEKNMLKTLKTITIQEEVTY